jgi:predicted MFS family arabinose efflux permease
LLLVVLCLCGFASSLSARLVDPLVSTMAAELDSPVAAIALLSSAYTLPLALAQPIMGPVGDFFGKGILIKLATLGLAIFLAVSTIAPSQPLLFVSRVCAGTAAAGILPVGFALIGDNFPLSHRQVAISRFLAFALIGQLVGASGAGFLSQWIGWRGVFQLAALIGFIAALAAFWKLPRDKQRQSGAFRVGEALDRYRYVIANPLAFVCFGIVFFEGGAIYGLMPYVAEFLNMRSGGGPAEAGFVIAGMGFGGLFYTLCVPLLLRFIDRRQMMLCGGFVAAVGLGTLALGLGWVAEAMSLMVAGFGFFLLHNPVQTEVSELAPLARASAFSLHALSFFLGQALGPVLYGWGFHSIGFPASLLIGGGVFIILGILANRLL